MRGRTKRKSTNEPQDLDPICSPHLEERLIGGNVDLDLLSLFPQKYARSMGGNKREASFSKGNNGGEREGEKLQPKEEEGAFYTPTTKYDRWSQIESFQTKTGLSGPDFSKNPAPILSLAHWRSETTQKPFFRPDYPALSDRIIRPCQKQQN